MSPARNPDWAQDELILALDLYFRYGLFDDRDPRVIELSELLGSLPLHTARPDIERFRNPNGVALKLANFSAIDPTYPGRGMSRGGRRDREVWERFAARRQDLTELASAIRIGATSGYPATTEEDEAEARVTFVGPMSAVKQAALVSPTIRWPSQWCSSSSASNREQSSAWIGATLRLANHASRTRYR